MKKLTTMPEDELLTPLSDPVPRGLQKQFHISKRLLISPVGLGLAGVLCGLALPSALQADDQAGPGFNGFDTVTTLTKFDGLPWEGVPLGTFDFGSGTVNVGNTDTIIQRVGYPVTAPGGTMALDVVALQLQTVNQVSLEGGPVGYYFATLDTSAQNTGVLTIDSFPITGSPGTFNDYFTVNFDVRYGSLAGPIVAEQGLQLTASGDWLTAPPIPSIPIVHEDPTDTDLHVVTLDRDSDIPDNGFYPFGVPETFSTLALLGIGTLSLLACDWRRRTAKA
jgi:hypothetical protein